MATTSYGRHRKGILCEYFPFRTLRAFKEGRSEAVRAVSEARQDGRLVPQPCVVCGAESAHAHHEDYRKPREIAWLCRDHHTARHHELKNGNALPIPTVCFEPKVGRRGYTSRAASAVAHDGVRRATEAVANAMEASGLSESAIARRMGVRHQTVTTKTLAAFAEACDCDIVIKLVPRRAVGVA